MTLGQVALEAAVVIVLLAVVLWLTCRACDLAMWLVKKTQWDWVFAAALAVYLWLMATFMVWFLQLVRGAIRS
jgi:hypothetical protein